MSELRDAMRMAQSEPAGRRHPPGTKLCSVCKGQGWLWVEFQSEFCNPHGMDTRQTRQCKACNETGIMSDDRFAMLALQGEPKNGWPIPEGVDEKNFPIHGRLGITFKKTYVWTGLDWIEYENPFYVRSKREGRSE